MRLLFPLFLIFVSGTCYSQQLNGTWKGLGWTVCESAYVELKLEQSGNTIRGESIYIFNNNRFYRYFIEGSYSPTDSTVFLKETKLLSSKKNQVSLTAFSTYKFKLKESSIGQQLKGSAETRTPAPFNFKRADADYELTRSNPLDSIRLKQAALNSDRELLKMAWSRTDKTVKTFETAQDSILVYLYDNGQIDGDTVSLIFNDKPIVVRLALDQNLKPFTLYTDKSQKINKLVFMAHNLGSIPPNTGTLRMTINGKPVEVYLSADLSRNATIEFVMPPREPELR